MLMGIDTCWEKGDPKYQFTSATLKPDNGVKGLKKSLLFCLAGVLSAMMVGREGIDEAQVIQRKTLFCPEFLLFGCWALLK